MKTPITSDNEPGDHRLFVLFHGRTRESRYPDAPDLYGFGRLSLGRVYRLDELEIVTPPV